MDCEQPGRSWAQPFALRCEADLARGAVEQADAELVLQPGDVAAERLLGDKSRAAARPKCSSSATARNRRSSRGSSSWAMGAALHAAH